MLKAHGSAQHIFARVNALLACKRQSLRAGRIVDTTIIAETKKHNQWHFGMKAHIGVDDESGLVHHEKCTRPMWRT